jgi:4-amino-4-deoxy-L-arabinose transferase-like glycosyltransferase
MLYCLCLLGFCLRVHGLTTQSLWRDEVDSWRFALAAEPAWLLRPGWNGPAYHLALRGWILAAGQSEYALRFPSALASAACLPALWWLSRELMGRRAALIAIILLSCSPYHIWYAQEAKMYALLGLMSIASFAFLWRALSTGGAVPLGLYALSTALLPYIHVFGVLLIPAQLVAAACTWGHLPGRRLLSFALLVVGPALLYVPLGRWQLGLFLSGFRTGHPDYTLGQMLGILARGWPLGIVAAAEWWLAMPHALGLSAGVIEACRRESWRLRFVVAWLTVPLFLVFLVCTRTPLFADRYLIGSLPAFVLLTASGLERLLARRKWLGVGAAGLAVAAALYGVWMQGRFSIKADMRGAAAMTLQGWRDGDALLLQIPYLEHSARYYLGAQWEALPGPYTNGGMSEDQVGAYLAERLAGSRRVWLWLSEASIWDERGLTLKWLDEHCRATGHWELARVAVYLFEGCDGASLQLPK